MPRRGLQRARRGSRRTGLAHQRSGGHAVDPVVSPWHHRLPVRLGGSYALTATGHPVVYVAAIAPKSVANPNAPPGVGSETGCSATQAICSGSVHSAQAASMGRAISAWVAISNAGRAMGVSGRAPAWAACSWALGGIPRERAVVDECQELQVGRHAGFRPTRRNRTLDRLHVAGLEEALQDAQPGLLHLGVPRQGALGDLTEPSTAWK